MKRLLLLYLLWLAIGAAVDITVEARTSPHKPGGWTNRDRAIVVFEGPIALAEELLS